MKYLEQENISNVTAIVYGLPLEIRLSHFYAGSGIKQTFVYIRFSQKKQYDTQVCEPGGKGVWSRVKYGTVNICMIFFPFSVTCHRKALREGQCTYLLLTVKYVLPCFLFYFVTTLFFCIVFHCCAVSVAL